MKPKHKVALIGLGAAISGPDLCSANLRPVSLSVHAIKYEPPPPMPFIPPLPKEPWRGGRPR